MSKSKSISHSNGLTLGDGKCSCCHKKIQGLFMVINHYDMKSRGNEGDYTTTQCENCINPEDKVYIKYLSDKKKEERQRAKDANDPLRFAKIVGGECTYESEYDGRMYEHCFYCNVNIGDGDDHDADCAHLEAKALLKAKGIS